MTSPSGSPTAANQRHEQLKKLAPSAKLVYKALEYNELESMTQSELAAETRLSSRTVRDALSKLTEIGLVTEEPYLLDARYKLYRLR